MRAARLAFRTDAGRNRQTSRGGAMADTRVERDSMGEMVVPANAYYGAQTARAVENFPISGLRFPRSFIAALGTIKGACARVNAALGLLDRRLADTIRRRAAAA